MFANVFVYRREFVIIIDDFVVYVKLNDFVVYFENFLLSIVFVLTNEKIFFEFELFVIKFLQMNRQKNKLFDNFVFEILFDDDENVDFVN